MKRPEATAEQEAEIQKTAQGILDARALYPDCSLADLYDEVTMPIELRKAHQANDKAVMKACGYSPTLTEPEIVADLMKRYQALTAEGLRRNGGCRFAPPRDGRRCAYSPGRVTVW